MEVRSDLTDSPIPQLDGGGGEVRGEVDDNERDVLDLSNTSRWTEIERKKFSEMFDNAWNTLYRKDEDLRVNKSGENKEADPFEADDNFEAAKMWALSQKKSGH